MKRACGGAATRHPLASRPNFRPRTKPRRGGKDKCHCNRPCIATYKACPSRHPWAYILAITWIKSIIRSSCFQFFLTRIGYPTGLIPVSDSSWQPMASDSPVLHWHLFLPSGVADSLRPPATMRFCFSRFIKDPTTLYSVHTGNGTYYSTWNAGFRGR